MIGAPGLRKMQLKKVKDVEEKNKIIAEFLKNRKILRQRLIDEKLGKQELAIAAERAQRPVTTAIEKAQKRTDEKQDKVIEQLQDNQDKILEALQVPNPIPPYQRKVFTESESDTDDPFPDLSDVEQKKKDSIFPEAVTKRLIYMNIDPSLNVMVDDSILQRVWKGQEEAIEKAKGKYKKAVETNRLKALREYQTAVESRRSSLANAPPSTRSPITQEELQEVRCLGITSDLQGEELKAAIAKVQREIKHKRQKEDAVYGDLSIKERKKANTHIEKLINQKRILENYELEQSLRGAPPPITLEPYWFTYDTQSTLRSIGVDPKFIKIPTMKDLTQAMLSKWNEYYNSKNTTEK